jgi:drug/metabolite transporter (DMT)-like permease
VTPAVVALALGAALLHASWNAVLRSGADRLWSITIMSFTTTLIAIPFGLLLPLPPARAWGYLVASSCLQVGYCFFLVAAYRYGELGQVYPIMRGTVPLLVTIGGFLSGQKLSGPTVFGVALVAVGIMSLALDRGRPRPTSVLYAASTGLIIACYTLVDASGVRATGDPILYATWISLLYGPLLLITVVVIRRGRVRLDLHSAETVKAAVGGALSLIAYAAVIAALALGPAGPVSALRETSVVFAALIGWLFLKEDLTVARVSACVVIALGAVSLT